MDNLKIPKKYDQSRILIADDEPEHLDWLIDYFNGKKLQTTVVTSVKAAMEASENTEFRAYIIDLNIPLGGWNLPIPLRNETYKNYGGLYIIKLVRSQGKREKNVIAYSAHANEQIASEIKCLYCKYIVKGRPRELKAEIERILAMNLKVSTKVIKKSARKSKKNFADTSPSRLK